MSDSKPAAEKQAPIEVVADALAISLALGFSGTTGEATAAWAKQAVEALGEAGYVILPREPTEAMVERSAEAIYLTMPSGVREWRDAPTYTRDRCIICAKAAIVALGEKP
jgi:hypothetical protein